MALNRERIKDLAHTPFDRARPEIPQDVHDERKMLAQLLMDDTTQGPTKAMLKLAGEILKAQHQAKITPEDADKIALRVIKRLRAEKVDPRSMIKSLQAAQTKMRRYSVKPTHLVVNPKAVAGVKATVAAGDELVALGKSLGWWPGKPGRPPKEVSAFLAARRAAKA